MKYNVTHVTEYRYREPVPLSHSFVHLKPRRTEWQSLLSHAITVTPDPIIRSERIDFFGNPATWFCVQEPHEGLKVVAQSTVDVKPFAPRADLCRGAWEEAVKMLQTRREPAFMDARQFVFDSPFATADPALAEYANPSFSPGRPMLECVSELTQRIYKEFKFDSTATTIGTPILDVLRHRHGVCQDFAHLQIGCLRSLGLAARYVSGYLSTQPPPGQPRVVGGDASHAWVAAFFPDYGWIDFDPTNGVIPSSGHITLGWAREYDEISPVRGVVVGGRHHTLGVSVDVEPIGVREIQDGKIVA